jgi:sugar phosphate isomerase/epimerase
MTRPLPASSDIPKKEYSDIVRRRLHRVANILENHEIRLALEFIGPLHLRTARRYTFIWRMDETLEFAASVESTIGLLLDSWHWHHIGGNKQDILSAGALTLNVQVSDARELQPKEVKDSERLLPGQGVVNFEEFFQGLRLVGYNGLLTPEIFGYRSEFSNLILSARKALKATKDMLNKALLENK